MRVVVALFLVQAGLGSLVGQSTVARAEEMAKLTVGTVFPETGSQAAFGKEAEKGLDLALDVIRQKDPALAQRIIIVRGDGCHLEDSNGRRYIDALAGLFSVNIGYSFGEEIGQASGPRVVIAAFFVSEQQAGVRGAPLRGVEHKSRDRAAVTRDLAVTLRPLTATEEEQPLFALV